MILEYGTFEILHSVGVAVQLAYFHELATDRIALLGQTPVLLPVSEELAADYFIRFRERLTSSLSEQRYASQGVVYL
jgi:hypothetical protein